MILLLILNLMCLIFLCWQTDFANKKLVEIKDQLKELNEEVKKG